MATLRVQVLSRRERDVGEVEVRREGEEGGCGESHGDVVLAGKCVGSEYGMEVMGFWCVLCISLRGAVMSPGERGIAILGQHLLL